MSLTPLEVLEAIDASTTVGVAATLTGLSLTAASLLINVVRTQGDRVDSLREKMEARQKDWADLRSDGGASKEDKAAAERLHDSAVRRHKDANELANDVRKALQTLIWAFVLFSINLVEALSLDPLVDNSIAVLKDEAIKYIQLLSIDVGISTGTMALGIIFLWASAREIYKAIPHL
ncbi:MAG: hypothetical protein IPM20_06360 [Gammaproteobacteria bacterium]|nr:hypothetical protein [Gammaproteobacteria bacterium]